MLISLWIGSGAPVNVIGFLAGRYFGIRYCEIVFGVLPGALAVAIGLGSWIAGRVFDIRGAILQRWSPRHPRLELPSV